MDTELTPLSHPEKFTRQEIQQAFFELCVIRFGLRVNSVSQYLEYSEFSEFREEIFPEYAIDNRVPILLPRDFYRFCRYVTDTGTSEGWAEYDVD